MTFDLPVYVEKIVTGGNTEFRAEPLFVAEPARSARGRELARALATLTGAMRKLIRSHSDTGEHDAIARYLFPADWADGSLTLRIALRRRTFEGRFHVVAFACMGRRYAFSPSAREVWFEFSRGESLPERATEALSEYYRKVEKDEPGKLDVLVAAALARKQTLTTTVELDADLKGPRGDRKKPFRPFAFLGGDRTFLGGAELESVGRCLDFLYPDRLDRVNCQAEEARELERLLQAHDKQPLMIVGPSKVGKTALLHEVIYRRAKARRSPYGSRDNVWLISPQRLISGMSYVGQWEERLLSILEEVRKKGHILYFDDILGLFQAGVCGDSDLSVAYVLKPYLERREVRIVGEMTTEAFHVLQEKDRRFADLFHLIRIAEPTERETCRILIRVMRRLETKYRCAFDVDVLPTVMSLQRRCVRDLAFPGKAASFLQQLAVSAGKEPVTRRHALDAFQEQSGLSVEFLDTRVATLQRSAIVEQLRANVVGQTGAVEAMADVVSVARAGLNDPGRPPASFLFLGPTGVGKTQCAKALAAFLFGSADRVLRFDMNEFVAEDAAVRLAGSFASPEGLLTSAVRRQPFCVLLLDEIEKANPAVFQLLLQVLGEGRLTNARGQTVDFSNAIVILTSNLGSRQAGRKLGFDGEVGDRSDVYVEAAEKFFAPEFFNRIDRVVPFSSLSRDEVGLIARMVLNKVLMREGLTRRKCVLDVTPPALERIVSLGYDPRLGARPLKRSIEQQLTAPLAGQLARLSLETTTVVTIHRRLDELLINADPLAEAKPFGQRITVRDPARVPVFLAAARAALDRLSALLGACAPDEPFDPLELTLGEEGYLLARELTQKIRFRLQRLRELSGGAARTDRRPNLARPGRVWVLPVHSQGGVLAKLVGSAADLREDLTEMDAGDMRLPTAELRILGNDLRLLALMCDSLEHDSQGEVLLVVRGASDPCCSFALLELYAEALQTMSLSCRMVTSSTSGGPHGLLVHGIHAAALLGLDVGTHLERNRALEGLGWQPLQLHVCPVPSGVPPLEVAEELERRYGDWLAALARGETTLEEDPCARGPVLRVYERNGFDVDLRTGICIQGATSPLDLRDMLLGVLTLPEELMPFVDATDRQGD